MRADMAKVIVERPRYGSSMPSKKKGYSRSMQRHTIDELPLRESMLGRWRGMGRHLNEHLRPMARFLRSNVGRPWNKVHEELCEFVSFNNAVQKHILSHIYQFVTQFVEIRDDQAFDRESSWHRLPLQLGAMYICPTTGLLKVVRRKPRGTTRRLIQVGPLKQLHLKENSWWEIALRKRDDVPADYWDIWLEREAGDIAQGTRHETYGGDLVAVSRRPLGPAEVKQLHRQYDRRSRQRKRSAKSPRQHVQHTGPADVNC